MARRCSTICLPASKEAYLACIDSPAAFRRWLDAALRRHPELFPKAFAHGYTLKDDRTSAKLGLRLRRVECNNDNGPASTSRTEGESDEQ